MKSLPLPPRPRSRWELGLPRPNEYSFRLFSQKPIEPAAGNRACKVGVRAWRTGVRACIERGEVWLRRRPAEGTKLILWARRRSSVASPVDAIVEVSTGPINPRLVEWEAVLSIEPWPTEGVDLTGQEGLIKDSSPVLSVSSHSGPREEVKIEEGRAKETGSEPWRVDTDLVGRVEVNVGEVAASSWKVNKLRNRYSSGPWDKWNSGISSSEIWGFSRRELGLIRGVCEWIRG